MLSMKIKNEDLKTLTGIKQYFLDPPRSFRLYGFAIPKAEEAIRIVEQYPKLQPMLDGMKESYDAMKELEGKNDELRKRMIGFGNLFGYLNR